MSIVLNIVQKAAKRGPAPYLALSAAIMALGAVMQVRAGAIVVGSGGTVFGSFAQIGGIVGIIGLLVGTIKVTPGDAGDDTNGDAAPEAPMKADKQETAVETSEAKAAGPSLVSRIASVRSLLKTPISLKLPALPSLRRRAQG